MDGGKPVLFQRGCRACLRVRLATALPLESLEHAQCQYPIRQKPFSPIRLCLRGPYLLLQKNRWPGTEVVTWYGISIINNIIIIIIVIIVIIVISPHLYHPSPSLASRSRTVATQAQGIRSDHAQPSPAMACDFPFGVPDLERRIQGTKLEQATKLEWYQRPCVDCGLVTSSFCEGPYDTCYAIRWSPGEVWGPGQYTPYCTRCQRTNDLCHYCRAQTHVVPPPWEQDYRPITNILITTSPKEQCEIQFPKNPPIPTKVDAAPPASLPFVHYLDALPPTPKRPNNISHRPKPPAVPRFHIPLTQATALDIFDPPGDDDEVAKNASQIWLHVGAFLPPAIQLLASANNQLYEKSQLIAVGLQQSYGYALPGWSTTPDIFPFWDD